MLHGTEGKTGAKAGRFSALNLAAETEMNKKGSGRE